MDDAIRLVSERNEFYFRNYRACLSTTLLLILALCIMAGLMGYQLTHPQQPRYFATTAEGRILPIYPLSKPNMSPADLLNWAQKAAIAAYTYDFVSYRTTLQTASEYFTPDGWRKFMQALTDSNNLTAVKAKRLIVSATPAGDTVLVKQGIVKDIYTWRVKVPLEVIYQNSEQYSKQQVTVTMTVKRVPNLNSLEGLGISQFVVTST